MTQAQATQIRKSVKKSGAACRVVTVGTGKHVQLALYGNQAAWVAENLARHGVHPTPLSGDGSCTNPITIDMTE